MPWKKLIITTLVLLTAGWMLFDGSRALIVGDYVTEPTGEYAGQLGPWANLLQGFGIEPRSTLMKSIIVLYGLLALATLWCYWAGYPWAGSALMIVCFLGLWYLPFGTVANLIVLFLMMMAKRRQVAIVGVK
jgi:hypothetical protein